MIQSIAKIDENSSIYVEWEEEAERSLWTKDADESDASSDLPFFTRNEIAAATDNFSWTNKLGEGGFGSVYKVEFLWYYAIVKLF